MHPCPFFTAYLALKVSRRALHTAQGWIPVPYFA